MKGQKHLMWLQVTAIFLIVVAILQAFGIYGQLIELQRVDKTLVHNIVEGLGG